MVRGRCGCLVGEEHRELGPGEVLLIPAGVPHNLGIGRAKAYREQYVLHAFTADRDHRSLFARLSTPYGRLAEPAGWNRRLGCATHLLGREPATGRTYARHLLQDLLVEQVMAGASLQALPPPLDHRIANLLRDLRLNCEASWTVSRMAARCGLSEGRLRELFRIEVGTGPKSYLQRLRLQKARALLLTQPSLTVAEVATRVGFGDARHFHAIYRETFGCTPKGEPGAGPEP